MNSRVIKDYFRSFKMNKKMAFEKAMILSPIWIGPLYSIGILSEEKPGISEWIYFWGMVVFLLGMSGMAVNPLRLPKVMYLCPLTMEQRYEYLRKMFQIRFLLPAAIFVIGRGIIWLVYSLPLRYFLFDIMFLFSIYASNYLIVTGDITVMEAKANQPKLVKEKELEGMGIKSFLSFIVGIVVWFIVSMGMDEPIGAPNLYIWGIGVVIFVWQLYLTIRLTGYKSHLISLACDYERMWVA